MVSRFRWTRSRKSPRDPPPIPPRCARDRGGRGRKPIEGGLTHMMRALFAGVSGLRNHQTRMDVIGNNIANVNTVGFKSSRVTFQEAFVQLIQGASRSPGNLGGTNPIQIGTGVNIGSTDTLFTQGSL